MLMLILWYLPPEPHVNNVLLNQIQNNHKRDKSLNDSVFIEKHKFIVVIMVVELFLMANSQYTCKLL